MQTVKKRKPAYAGTGNANKFLTPRDRVVLLCGHILLLLFLLVVTVPILYVVLASFMDPATRSSVGISFDISKWSLEGYVRVFQDENIWRGFRNSFLYSLLYTFISVAVSLLAAYPLSRRDFMGKGFFNTVFIITMFFGGGLMPTYLLIDQLGLIDSVWAVILPNAVNVWNIILARSYYKSIPSELREAASVDGASDTQYFFRILLPVCVPIIAVLCLYQFVAQWNSYFDAMIYLDDQAKQPLQLVIRAILVQNQINPNLISDMEKLAETAKLADLLKYSTIVISSLPLVLMYPFFSKYFDKGIMIGSIKG